MIEGALSRQEGWVVRRWHVKGERGGQGIDRKARPASIASIMK
jgi:hypothetical protein